MHLRFAVLVLLNKTTDPGAILYVQNGQIKLHKVYVRGSSNSLTEINICLLVNVNTRWKKNILASYFYDECETIFRWLILSLYSHFRRAVLSPSSNRIEY